jgi:glycosyltransferase involved in cell wall biosynthesis
MGTIEAALRAEILQPEFPMLVVGAPDGLQDEVPAAVREAIDAGLVRYIGFVSDEELAWLYSNCRFFTFLSLDEGYGLPPLEALHFGAPVLASDIPVFRELLSESPDVHFSNPHDLKEIAAAMARLALSERSTPTDSIISSHHSWEAVVTRMRGEVLRTVRRAA